MNIFSVICVCFVAASTVRSQRELNVLDTIFQVNQVQGEEDKYSSTIPVELFEGDIVWNKKLKSLVGEMRAISGDGMSPFDAIARGQWPYAEIPYTFAAGFRDGTVVRRAIAEYNNKTCIRWKPYTRHLARKVGGYVEFFHGGGCYSMIGKQGGKQQISLGRGCGVKGIAIHEMMHALGFFHEQSRRDRDSYITINWSNINRAMYYNFEKYRQGQASTLGEPYDKRSVMHYGNYAFSINRRQTIVSKSNPRERLGQTQGLSVIDVRQLNKYYKCGRTATKRPTTVTKVCNNLYRFCTVLGSWCSNTWVKSNCKKSCNLCVRPTEPVKPKNCVDKNRYCRSWANKYCRRSSTFYNYMMQNCAKSCGKC